jgi:hypothetical protein
MPVVINEFEVVPAPEAPPRPETKDHPSTPPGVTPQDVERIVARTGERAARVRAH